MNGVVNAGTLRSHRRRVGGRWFTRPWDLNVFVVRSERVGEWDDALVVVCRDEHGRLVEYAYQVTADAWEGEWREPTHPDGCLYIVDQHAAAAYEPGLHRGRKALRQVAPMEYVRWPRDAGRVPTVAELEALPRFEAVRGTHIHDRPSGRQPAKPAPDDSEGCVVFLRRPDRDHFLALVEMQRQHIGTARVSVTFVRRTSL